MLRLLRQHRKFALLATFIIACCASFRLDAQASDAPYLFYYSPELQTWIIERADGTDSRSYGENMEMSHHFQEPRWSPSGEWVALTAGRRRINENGTSFSAETTSVFSIHDSTLFPPLNQADGTIVEWSPVEDLLFVIERDLDHPIPYTEYLQTFTTRFTLYDMRTGSIVVEYERLLVGIGQNQTVTTPISWAPDGNALVYHEFRPTSDSGHYIAAYQVFVTKDGAVSERFIHYDPELGGFPNRWVLEGWYPIPEGYVYPSTSEMRHITYSVPSIASIYDPQNQFVLLYEYLEADRYNLWQMMLEDGETRLLATDIRDLCRDNYNYSSTDTRMKCWSPDGRSFIVINQRDDLLVLTFDSAGNVTLRVVQLDSPRYVVWRQDSAGIFYVDTEQEIVVNYDFAAGILQSYRVNLFEPPVYSPSRTYLYGFGPNWSSQNLRILNLSTGEWISTRYHSNATILGNDIQWSLDEEWILIGDSNCIAGGCAQSVQYISVSRLDGSEWRELPNCTQIGTCSGWVPEHVVPHLAPGQPETPLRTPIAYHFDVEYMEHGGWGRSRYVIGCDTPESEDAYIIDSRTQLRLYQLIDTGITYCRCSSPQYVRFRWNPDQTLMVLMTGDDVIFLYDIHGEQVAAAVGFRGYFSTDGERLIIRKRRASVTWRLEDVLAGWAEPRYMQSRSF